MSDVFEFEDKAKVDRLIGTLHDPTATPGDVLTVQADKSIAAAPGGGSMPTLEWLSVPLSFDTPNLVVQQFAVTALDQGTRTITMAGEHAALFPADKGFAIHDSTGNDGTYTVESVTETGGNTEIVTVEALPDATEDGSLTNSGTAGVHIASMGVGDILLGNSTDAGILFCFIFLPVAWDGALPVLLLTTSTQQANYANIALEQQGLDNTPDTDYFEDGALFDARLNSGFNNFNLNGPMRAEQALDLVALVDSNNSGAPPGSTVGEAILVVQILRAA